MRAGRLNRRVVIQAKAAGQDEFGAEVTSWTAWRTVWANVRPLSGDAYFQAAQKSLEARVDAEIVMRFQPGIEPERMRAVHGTDVYEIEAVLQRDERRRETVLMVRRQV